MVRNLKVGIPRGLFYYFYSDLWMLFFDKLGIDYIVSPETNREIKNLGNKYSTDEMCLSMKIYIGHVAFLSDKCDFLLVPRIDNYGRDEQTCTNFLACYDIINNLFNTKVIGYNISLTDGDTEKRAFMRLGKVFKKSSCEIKKAYYYALYKSRKIFKNKIIYNMNNLNKDGKKILLVSHPYNTYDSTIGKCVTEFLNNVGCIVIYSDLFDKKLCMERSLNLCSGLYWKYSREIVGSIDLCIDSIDGIIFLSTFPCGLDSLVNELIIRKINKKCLNLVIDDMDAFAGIETRLESFVDIV